MEYLAGGSCGDLLKPGPFKEEYIAIVVRELLKGLDYLHSEGKLHRDIKGPPSASSASRLAATDHPQPRTCYSTRMGKVRSLSCVKTLADRSL